MLDANSSRRGLSTIFHLSLGPAPGAPSAFVDPSWLRVPSLRQRYPQLRFDRDSPAVDRSGPRCQTSNRPVLESKGRVRIAPRFAKVDTLRLSSPFRTEIGTRV
jgi:hypothetical protein